MKKRSAVLAVATCAIAAVITLAGTTFAHAYITEIVHVSRVGSTGSGGYISFDDDGDLFRVGDSVADGHGVRGSLLSSSGKVLKSSYNGKGAHNATTRFSYDVKGGGVKYYMKVCLVDGASDTTPIKCASRVLYE